MSLFFRVKSLKRGPIANDGTMGTVLADVGNIYKGTCSIKQEKATTFDVEVEQQDDPEASFTKKGKKTLAYSLTDLSPETQADNLGGTIVNSMWQEPDFAPNIEESFQFITQSGMLIEIPRGKLSANLNLEGREDAVGLIEVEVRPLKPTGAGVKAFSSGPYQVPTVNAGVDKASALATSSLAGTASAFRGTISSQLWTCVSKPNAAAAPGIATPSALNTNLTGLVNGVYVFKLTVEDSNDFEGSDTITVTVTIP